MNKPPSRSDEPRINHQIRVPQIRLIDENGEMLGLSTVQEGIRKAEAVGLDLVEISPTASPPVCKILDYGKYKYEAQKKAHEAKKKQKVITIKEIQLRPTIDDNDFNIKMRRAEGFLEDGDKVKFVLRFRGREMAHQKLGYELLQRVKETFGETIKVEQEPKLEGRQMLMMVTPAK